MQLLYFNYYCDQPSSFSQAPSACGVQCSTKHLVLININMMKKSQEFPGFVGAAERNFQSLAGPRNVIVDLKYDILCL